MVTIVRREPELTQCEFSSELHPILQKIYAARGITSGLQLEKGLEKLTSYEALLNIEQAVCCLYEALCAQYRIMIVGDFDADGATSTAVIVSALKNFGAKFVNYLVPNRFEFGYGLTPEIVDVAKDWQPDLIVTVDNGIASCDGVARANELGIKVMITDHHLPGERIPDAEVIINPNQEGDSFPSKNLAGVGVVFYIMLALRRHLREKNWFQQQDIVEPNMASLLDLVALGTVADVVPLDHNNRVLVHQGIARMRVGKMRPGIQALLEIGKRNPVRLVAADLGFAVAPRLNAAGRLDDMSLGIECLLSQDIAVARQMAQQLDELNQERRHIEADMKVDAFKEIDKLHLESAKDLPLGLCLFYPHWHQGVVGILAARVKEALNRPVIAFAKADQQQIKGSARSIAGFHIRDALDAIATRYPGLVKKFGGHAMAAGLTINEEDFDVFAKAFDDEVRRHLQEADLQGTVISDGELRLQDFTIFTAEMLREAGPWGQAFPEPLFDGTFKLLQQRIVGTNHLKMVLGMDDSLMLIDAIAFNIDSACWPNHRCEKVNIAYRLDINEFRGKRSLQLIVEHLAPV